MKIKIIASVITIIVLTVAITAGATYAIFSDTENIDGNVISAANVSIELQGLLKKPIEATNMIPGQYTDWGRAYVYNTEESTNVKMYIYATDLTGNCSRTNIELRTGFPDQENAASEREILMYEGPLSGIEGEANRKEINIGSRYVEPKAARVIQQRAQLDPAAENELQGTSCAWDEVIVAEAVQI